MDGWMDGLIDGIGDTKEIHENIQFYTDNIQGITKELEMHKGW